MSTNFSTLVLKDVMMHQVVRNSGSSGPRFSLQITDMPVVLSGPNRSFLEQRFIKALSQRALPIVEDKQVGSPTPDRVRAFWSDRDDLVVTSQGMAEDLAQLQPGTALAGLLVLAEVQLSSGPALLVAKVEHQDAMRIEAQVNENGERIFSIERLKELVFGDAARIYKIAILSKAASAAGLVSGEVVDDQNSGFAAYFLGKFMGMKLREEPAVLTQHFLERMTTAINKSSLVSEARLDLQSALVAEVASNARQLDPQSFIQNHVPQGAQSEIAAIAADLHVPLVVFPKDTTRVQSQLKRLRLDLSNDIHVIAPPEAVGDGKAVQIIAGEGDEEGTDTVVITGGKLVKVKGNGSR
ncbi:hypothetical protein HD599_001175 [Conyzicola lurida]|uniref:Nucleoid-associated protein n=1 Tax=Conyzicola lurida TaxID=1172621 RepID=A0A841ALK8_9MICO|nr:nucleoid-associated protein [Conyzicola lurida]MBB5842852.1 hypothetical protein [Conyzicola lurida]